MDYEVKQLQCPACGAPVSPSISSCEYCGSPLIISSAKSIFSATIEQVKKMSISFQKAVNAEPENAQMHSALAYCFMRLKMFGKALAAFEKSIDISPDNAEIYFYAALCALNGKKPYLHTREEIEKIESYANAAIEIEDKGLYNFFLAYIRYDYHYRKHLKVSPSFADYLHNANYQGINQTDKEMIFNLSGLECPEELL